MRLERPPCDAGLTVLETIALVPGGGFRFHCAGPDGTGAGFGCVSTMHRI